MNETEVIAGITNQQHTIKYQSVFMQVHTSNQYRYGLRSQEGLRFSDGYQACGRVYDNARYMYKCILIHLLKLCFNMGGRFRFLHMYLIKVSKIFR